MALSANTTRTRDQLIEQIRFDIRDVDDGSSTTAFSDATLALRIEDSIVKYVDTMGRSVASLTGTEFSGVSGIADAELFLLLTPTNLREVLNVTRESAGANLLAGPPMERADPWDIIQRQNDDSTKGAPTAISIEHGDGEATIDVGRKLTLRAHPIPDATYFFSAQVRVEAPRLGAGDDQPNLTDVEARHLGTVVAYNLAPMQGLDPDYIQELARRVPKEMREIFGIHVRALDKPRPFPGKAAA